MMANDKKSSDDWLPETQGVAPPDPEVSHADTKEVQRSKAATGEPENNVLQGGKRTADNWDLGGNS